MNHFPDVLPDTRPLTRDDDLAAAMVAGIDAYLERAATDAATERAARWQRDCSSPVAYIASIQDNRDRFARLIGLIDDRTPPGMEIVTSLSAARTPFCVRHPYGSYTVFPVRWRVFPDVEAEGLLLAPDNGVIADVVALPDADRTPEAIAGLTPDTSGTAFAHRLAASGCRVVIPVMVDRRDTHAGIPGIRMTNQPHREFIYRAAYECGRYLAGFETQMVLSVVDWFIAGNAGRPVGVTGYGEGGLVALYAGAVDPRIDVTVVSGYFAPRERLHDEPIYRNIFGLLTEFGDAEIASLIVPRTLIVEACRHPEVAGPPAVSEGRSGAAPGGIVTPDPADVQREFDRVCAMTAELHPAADFTLILSGDGYGPPGDDRTLSAMLAALKAEATLVVCDPPAPSAWVIDTASRHRRQFERWLGHTQRLMREAEFRRGAFWAQADRSSPEAWHRSCAPYRRYFWDEILGRLPEAAHSPNPKSRKVYETDAFAGYEVILDVYDTVFAYGILLIPRGIGEGERRPVVVCQHGLEGRPQDVADPDVDHPAYHRFACRLAEKGYVTYAPQNPYIGGNAFRQLVRKAHPVKQTLYGFIVRQHEQTLKWLATLSFVDPGRMAFYGLSYGGKTAMRIPAVLEQYGLSICSADYNEWIWKNVSADHRYSYLITGEYDMPEYNLANTFNYAEMSWLICPRPFMVERGHDDGVAPDEWVAYEYARTRLVYDKLGLGDRTTLEIFDGPHTIHGAGTFDFLDHHLLI